MISTVQTYLLKLDMQKQKAIVVKMIALFALHGVFLAHI